jgi:hypothetical protein
MKVWRFLLIVVCFLFVIQVNSQVIQWNDTIPLQMKDFKANPPGVAGRPTVYPVFGVAFKMLNTDVFARNFNINVSCDFDPVTSWIDTGVGASNMLEYARISFDIYELCARKTRKDLLEHRGMVINRQVQEIINRNHVEMSTMLSDFIRDVSLPDQTTKLAEWKLKVRSLLDEYADYCRECKDTKRRKK